MPFQLPIIKKITGDWHLQEQCKNKMIVLFAWPWVISTI